MISAVPARLVGALVALSALASCTGQAPEAAPAVSTSSPAPAGPLNAVDALGDYTTYDSCDLVSQQDLATLGNPRAVPSDDIEGCAFRVGADGKPEVRVDFGSIHDYLAGSALPTLRTTELARGMRTQVTDEKADFCHELLLFVDGLAIQIEASGTGLPDGAACAVTHTVAEAAATRLVGGGLLGRMAWPQDSLGSLDACTLLDVDGLSSALALTEVYPFATHSRHRCSLRASNEARVSLQFHGADADQQPTVRTTVAARPTFIMAESKACLLSTKQGPGHRESTPAMVEMATLIVTLPEQDEKAACTMATTIADRVWPKLPVLS